MVVVVKPGIGYVDTTITGLVLPTIPIWHTIGCTPNVLTTLGLLSSGLCIFYTHQRNAVAALVFLWLRIFFDYADGLLARKYDQVTRVGDWYDHISDIAFAIGIIYILFSSKWYNTTAKWLTGAALFAFACLFLAQMGCIEAQYRAVITHEPETSISHLRHLCPHPSGGFLKACDNGTLYIILATAIYLFTRPT